jgi:putative selenium metabolism hydrolase
MNPEQQSVEFIQRLVKQPSFSGQEDGAIEVAAEEMRAVGFDDVWQDETGNLVGVLNGELPGLRVIFDAHVDVVPATTPEAWERPPFSGVLERGRVWGRGATDNKGSLSAMITGLAAVPRSELPGTIYVVGSVGEEKFEGIGLAQVVDTLKPDFVVVGEPTDCRLGFGQRGRARLVFSVKGTAAHSSADDQSGNAIYGMSRLVKVLEDQPAPKDARLGLGIQAPIELISDPYPSASTVPVECRLTVDRRLVLGESEESILSEYRSAISQVKSASVEIDTVTYSSYTGKQLIASDFHPAWITEPDSKWMKACIQALQSVDLPGELYPIPYCTNASYSAGVLGIPAVVFGPGSILQAHAMNEFLEVTELHRAIRAYQAMARLIGKL